MANDAFNNSPNMRQKDKRSPLQTFTNTNVSVNTKHWKHFGCPVYVLETELQQTLPFHKWRERSKVGIYLGKSPQHAQSVSLVLNRTTGLVSPQFHVAHDSSFHTTKDDHDPSIWQIKAGFVQAPTTHKAPAHQDDRKVPRKGKLGAKRPQQEGAPEQHNNKRIKRSKTITELNHPEPKDSPEPPNQSAEQRMLQQSTQTTNDNNLSNPRNQPRSEPVQTLRSLGSTDQTVQRLVQAKAANIIAVTTVSV